MTGTRFMGWVVIAATLLLLVPAPAAGYTTNDPDLNRVASIFAMRPVKAACYEPDEFGAPDVYGAWGYVDMPVGRQKLMHLDPLVCEGASNVNDESLPVWQRALGVMVLAHESYHLRRWGAAGHEAKVQCKAVRHWRVAARMLGATEETVEELWPAALAFHFEITEIPAYWDPDCRVPPLIPPA